MTPEELAQKVEGLVAGIRAYLQAHPDAQFEPAVQEVVAEAVAAVQKASDAILPPQNPEQSQAHEEALGHTQSTQEVEFHDTPPEPAKE